MQQILQPTEFPKRGSESRPEALKAWEEFLQPRELEIYRAVRDAIETTLAKKSSPLGEPTRKWTDDEFMDYALNADYPADIEERIEESWQR